MPAPTILTSADVGAPVLSGTDGTLYDVLIWALPLLGWTIAFNDAPNFKAVFRNSAVDGSGMYLRLNDLSSAHPDNARRGQVHIYDTMSDIDTGTNRAHPQDNSFWGKSSTTNTVVRPWRIIGNSTFFYFLPQTGVAYNSSMIYFTGDAIATLPAAGLFQVLSAGVNISSGTYWSAATFTVYGSKPAISSTVCMSVTMDHLGAGPPQWARVWVPSYHVAAASTLGSTGAYANPTTGRPELARLGVMSATSGYRGYIPGAYAPVGNWSSVHTAPVDIVAVETPDGIKTLRYETTSQYVDFASAFAALLIDELDWA